MNKALAGDPYIRKVLEIVELIASEKPSQPSVFDDITTFFVEDAKSTRQQLDLKISISVLQDKIAEGADAATEAELQAEIAKLDAAKQADENSRHTRLTKVRRLCQMVFDCCEGNSYPETQQKTAKFLAALWLIAEQSELSHQAIHQKLKVPYKMALTLRLVDEVIRKQICQVPNWQSFRQPEVRYNDDIETRKLWYATVATSAMTAALFQDAGLQHPLAVKLLHGADGKANPFRVLEAEERQSLLKMNYRFSVDYVTLGLGVDHATDYATPEQQVLSHATVLELVKDAYKPKSGIGQILKIPQIYTSVVLSTKPEFSRVDVPKGCALIDQLGKKGVLNSQLAEAFNAITGVFPQGFGINTTKYLGIVMGLNPKKQHEPNVLPLSAKANYPLPDAPQVAHKIENYYFSETRKQFTPSQNEQIEALVKQTDNLDPSWIASDTFHDWRAIWQRQ